MKPAVKVCHVYKGLFNPGRLRKALPAGTSVAPASGKKKYRGIMLDTFDSHLRQSGNVLLRLKGKTALLDLSTGSVLEQPSAGDWRFAEEIKGGVVGLQLMRLSQLRAFFPLCAIDVEQSRITILDELEKTVVRARASTLIRDGRKATWVTTEPLRGYNEEAALLNKALEAAGYTRTETPPDVFPTLGIKQALYTSKPEVVLDPQAPIFESACIIVRAFLAVARVNESGIQADLDTEFVHDYRVSLRRIRSLLNLFRGVYAEEDSQRLKAALADVMKQTNRLRDLDVYLLDRNSYYKLVPESMHAGLDIMFEVFVSERQDALEQVCTLLRSPEYREQMDALQTLFSDQGKPGQGNAAGEETLHFARRLVLKRYRKVSRIARSIDSGTPDDTVHELRIQCKKLRYLMEFFVPLFPSESIKPLVKSLKSLQDVLGRFNDYSVQRESLSVFVEQHPLRGRKGIRLAESGGALVATLFQLQCKAREEVEACIAGFANEETRRRFVRVFSN